MVVVRHAWPTLLSLSVLPFAGWVVVRLLGTEHGAPWMQLMSFTPYVAVAALLPLAAALLSRHWWTAGAAGALALALAGFVLPRVLADAGATRPGTTVRLITANLLFGEADPAALAALVRDRRADVLAVQELTPEAAVALDTAGLRQLLPHRSLHARHGSAGSALYSRYPLRDTGVRRMPAGHLQAYGTLLVPGAPPVRVESVHPSAPSDDSGARQWAREIMLQPAATPEASLRVLLGDFNSTLDHEGLRRLVATGYRDAAEVVGAGLRPTWPGNGLVRAPIPPVTIDHVLADRRIGIRDVSVHPLPGSDHRAVHAELSL